MRSPFPGMNPYLEHHAIWSDVHTRLIVRLADLMGPLVRPRYRISVEVRTYLAASITDDWSAKPDVMIVERDRPFHSVNAAALVLDTPIEVQVPMQEEMREHFLQVREIGSGRVITVIEILSPANKERGEGRRTYENKRAEILASRTHLVEIDLLRAGKPLPLRVLNVQSVGQYRILVSRAPSRPRAELYPFSLREPIPIFSLPLQQSEQEPAIDLNLPVQEVYESGGYDLDIDYAKSPVPPLDKADQDWMAQLLVEKNLGK